MSKHALIVLAEDDPDDRVLLEEAFQRVGVSSERLFVDDGEDLMNYLLGRGLYAAEKLRPPDLILLDLNMPRKDGREALAEIRAHPLLRRIPVVVLSTSNSSKDVQASYELGANSFITKPVSFDALVRVVRAVHEYWFGVVTRPNPS